MLNVKVDRGDPTDLYEQVAGEIRRAIADGEAKPGERLPPVKDLAAVLDVNTNTVLRALRLLRDEGLLEFRRGRGISVAGTPERGAWSAWTTERRRDLIGGQQPPLARWRRHHGRRRQCSQDAVAGWVIAVWVDNPTNVTGFTVTVYAICENAS